MNARDEASKPDRFVSMDEATLAKHAGTTKEQFREVLLRADEALQKSRTFTPTLPSDPKKRVRKR